MDRNTIGEAPRRVLRAREFFPGRALEGGPVANGPSWRAELVADGEVVARRGEWFTREDAVALAHDWGAELRSAGADVEDEVAVELWTPEACAPYAACRSGEPCLAHSDEETEDDARAAADAAARGWDRVAREFADETGTGEVGRRVALDFASGARASDVGAVRVPPRAVGWGSEAAEGVASALLDACHPREDEWNASREPLPHGLGWALHAEPPDGYAGARRRVRLAEVRPTARPALVEVVLPWSTRPEDPPRVVYVSPPGVDLAARFVAAALQVVRADPEGALRWSTCPHEHAPGDYEGDAFPARHEVQVALTDLGARVLGPLGYHLRVDAGRDVHLVESGTYPPGTLGVVARVVSRCAGWPAQLEVVVRDPQDPPVLHCYLRGPEDAREAAAELARRCASLARAVQRGDAYVLTPRARQPDPDGPGADLLHPVGRCECGGGGGGDCAWCLTTWARELRAAVVCDGPVPPASVVRVEVPNGGRVDLHPIGRCEFGEPIVLGSKAEELRAAVEAVPGAVPGSARAAVGPASDRVLPAATFSVRSWVFPVSVRQVGVDASQPLVWIDLETTGIAPGCRILEVGVCVTDADLDLLADPRVMTVALPAGVEVEPGARELHAASGLLDEVCGEDRWDCDDEASAEVRVLSYLHALGVPPGKAPLAGSSVHFDRRVLADRMPRLHDYLFRRNVDVSTLRELAARWRPDVAAGEPAPRRLHRALPDLEDSLALARYYRRALFSSVPPEVVEQIRSSLSEFLLQRLADDDRAEGLALAVRALSDLVRARLPDVDPGEVVRAFAGGGCVSYEVEVAPSVAEGRWSSEPHDLGDEPHDGDAQRHALRELERALGRHLRPGDNGEWEVRDADGRLLCEVRLGPAGWPLEASVCDPRMPRRRLLCRGPEDAAELRGHLHRVARSVAPERRDAARAVFDALSRAAADAGFVLALSDDLRVELLREGAPDRTLATVAELRARATGWPVEVYLETPGAEHGPRLLRRCESPGDAPTGELVAALRRGSWSGGARVRAADEAFAALRDAAPDCDLLLDAGLRVHLTGAPWDPERDEDGSAGVLAELRPGPDGWPVEVVLRSPEGLSLLRVARGPAEVPREEFAALLRSIASRSGGAPC